MLYAAKLTRLKASRGAITLTKGMPTKWMKSYLGATWLRWPPSETWVRLKTLIGGVDCYIPTNIHVSATIILADAKVLKALLKPALPHKMHTFVSLKPII